MECVVMDLALIKIIENRVTMLNQIINKRIIFLDEKILEDIAFLEYVRKKHGEHSVQFGYKDGYLAAIRRERYSLKAMLEGNYEGAYI